MSLTPEQEAALRAAEAKATPAPWAWWTSNSFRRLKTECWAVVGKDVLSGTVHPVDGHPDVVVSEADMALIALARNTLPVLLDELERLRAESQRLYELCGRACGMMGDNWQKAFWAEVERRNALKKDGA